MDKLISIIIPNFQGGATIGKCLDAIYASEYPCFEVIVVDDRSADNSIDVIKRFSCKLIQLETHSGAAQARNIGAAHSRGELLFFTDADCLLQKNTLSIISQIMSSITSKIIIGGTYTRSPHDNNFFSRFQSVFVHYSETRNVDHPDYIATHAMILNARGFQESGGFSEKFLPILEDVDFSHRMRQVGYRLIMRPEIQVQHVFNFSLYRSLRNAIRKSMYWTMYLIRTGSTFSDSGTASIGLKINVATWFLIALLTLLFLVTGNKESIVFASVILVIDLAVNRGLFLAFYHAKGLLFAFTAILYYLLLYPIAVGAGVLAGIVRYSSTVQTLRENA